MIEKFGSLPEFDHYVFSGMSMERMVFVKNSGGLEYTIQIKDGAFSHPVLFRKKEDKSLVRVPIEDVLDNEIVSLYRDIENIMQQSNKDYAGILPFAEYYLNGYKIVVSNLLEDIEYFKNIKKYPDELRLWVEVSYNEEEVCEVQYVISNAKVSEDFAYWHLQNYFIKSKHEKESKELIENVILVQGQKFIDMLNKLDRLHHLFNKIEERGNS
jgi:hypothetical protein